MAKVVFDLSMSLDGFVAGPNDDVEPPLGEGGERLHESVCGRRMFNLKSRVAK